MSDSPVVMSLQPSEEEQLLREAVRGIASSYGAEYMRQCEADDVPPTELWDALGSQGFLGVNLPEQFGGGGMGMTGLAAVQEELSLARTVLAMLIVSPAIAGSILVKHGTPEQQQEWLPGLAAATTRIAFAITEPDAGSNSHRLSTSATLDSDGSWRLNGQKYYISGVEHAQHVLVVARVRQDNGELGLPVLMIVDTDAPGFTREVLPTEVSWAEHQWTLYFDDVVVPADRLVGGAGGGLAAVFDGLNPERIMAAASGVGAAQVALDRACDYARTRTVWDAPIGSHQAIAHPLAEIHMEIEQTRLMLQKACALYDAGSRDAGAAANIAKYAAGEVAVKAADRAIQTHGGNGMSSEFGLVDLWRNARLLQIAPVSREMILNNIAMHSLDLPRSY